MVNPLHLGQQFSAACRTKRTKSIFLATMATAYNTLDQANKKVAYTFQPFTFRSQTTLSIGSQTAWCISFRPRLSHLLVLTTGLLHISILGEERQQRIKIVIFRTLNS